MKKVFKYILNFFNYSLLNNEVITRSDDTSQVVANILNLKEVKIIVDGGASIGETSKKFSELFQHAKIHAFEPFPKFFRILKENCKDHKRIIPYSFALSKTSKSELLNVNVSEGTNSLLKTEVQESHPHSDLLETIETIKVVTKTMDQLFPDETIDILKLDLQGGEFDALQGAENLLNQKRIKCIICEIMFEKSYKNQRAGSEILMYLEKEGFRILNFYQHHFHHGKLLQADIIFYHYSISSDIDRLQKKSFLPFSKYLIRK